MLADALRSCMLMASHCQNKPQVLTVCCDCWTSPMCQTASLPTKAEEVLDGPAHRGRSGLRSSTAYVGPQETFMADKGAGCRASSRT